MRICHLESRPTAGAQPARRRRRALSLMLLAAALLATIAAPARADVGEKIILRCTHNESLSGFSQADYRKALKEMEADTEEYGDCGSLIRQAALAAASGGGASGGGGAGQSAAAPTALAVTPSEQRAITHAQHAGSGPVKLAGGTVRPGVVHVDVSSALSSLPSPLLATLAFLLACLLLIIGGAVRNRIRVRRAD
jgi:hypothetical protein